MYYTLIDFEVQFGNTVNFRYLYNVHNRADSRDVIFRARSFYSGPVGVLPEVYYTVQYSMGESAFVVHQHGCHETNVHGKKNQNCSKDFRGRVFRNTVYNSSEVGGTQYLVVRVSSLCR